ncbi:MAG: penicillin-binding transpeptidase domain-containing protein, partial [Aquihabitans sp.]
TARAVASLVAVDPDELVAKVASSGPDAFVEVITLDRSAYDVIRDQIQPLPGTVFREEADGDVLPPNFARGLLGATDKASAETAEGSDGAIREGDIVGVSGLQLSQNDVLAGKAGLTVEAVTTDGTPRALKVFAAEPGQSITVTLDRRVQSVADATMANTEGPSALVAIRVSTGEVLAVANGPSGSSAYNRALIGRYAPGSVFKIASGLAVLEHGTTPDTMVDCPAEITVGKTFRNAGGFSLGAVPFRTDFSKSCNTAFVNLASTVTTDQLADTAARLGYRPLDIGAPLFGASVPTDGDATEHAAQMIGQGRVEATPLHVALATASVAAGRSVEPLLVIDPDAPEAPAGPELPADLIIQLREMMRLVVTEGTGTVLADVTGGEVRGKTGTAEFGTASPPETHAWITGYQGDVAFAVLVEGGGGGGAVAGPLAAQFLNTLANG